MYSSRARLFAFFIGSLFALTACGQPRYIDPLLEPHVDSFERRYSVHFPGNVVLSDLNSPVLGLCSMSVGGAWRLIQIDKQFAIKSKPNELEETVYHELGHCAMMLQHDETKDEYGCPVSIMYPYAFGTWWCWPKYQEKYYLQLENAWKTSFGKR